MHAGTRPSGQVLNLYNIVVEFCLCENTDSYSDTENLAPRRKMLFYTQYIERITALKCRAVHNVRTRWAFSKHPPLHCGASADNIVLLR